MFVKLSEIKEHVRLTAEEVEFDRELKRNLLAAEQRVKSYINRDFYIELPDEPKSTDILFNESIKTAILEVAGYYFDSKGSISNDIVLSMLNAYVGFLRVHP